MSFFKSNFRKKIIVVSSVGVSSIAVASVAGTLITYRDKIWPNKQSSGVDVPSTDDSTNPPSSGDTNKPNNPGTGDSGSNTGGNSGEDTSTDQDENRTGTMASSVVNQIKGITLEFKDTKANDYNVKQNYLEYASNGDFSKYSTTWDSLEKDLYLYINNLWTENNKNVDFQSVTITNNNSSTTNFVLGKTKVSFVIEIKIHAFKATIFKVKDDSYSLAKNDTKTLKIIAKDQVLTPTVNFSSNTYYLAWTIPTVTLNFDSRFYNSVTLSPCSSYSYAFQYTYDDLTNKQNYVQFYKANQSKALNMDTNKVKTQIQSYYEQQYSQDLDFIDYGISIVNVIRTNPTIKTLLENATPYVAKIAVELGILPSFLEPIISEGFKTNESFLKVFADNKDSVIQYVKENLPDVAKVAIPLINEIKPGMEESQIIDIIGLLKYFNLDDSITNIIAQDFLGSTNNPKSLYNIIIDNINAILNLILGSSSDNSIATGLSNLISLFTSVDSNNQLTPIFTVLFKDENNKKVFLESLSKIFNLSSLTNILDILVTNNKYITVDNIQSILNTIYNFAHSVFERKDDYSDFKTGYKNLTFTTEYVSNPKIDKTKQTINFSYKITFNIDKKITLDLTPIKKIFNGETIWKLINSFYNLSGIGWAVNKNWLYQGVMGFIPDNLSVGGTSSSKTETTYSANDSKLYVDAIKSGTNYNLGFKFDYTTNISFQDQTLISSITNNYKTGSNWKQIAPVIAWVDYYYSNFWRGILKNIIARDYTFTFRADVKYSNDVVATMENYDPNLYISGFTMSNNSTQLSSDNVYNKLSDYKEDQLFKTRDETSYNIKWSNTSNNSELLKSLTPIIPQDVTSYIASNDYTINTNNNYLSGTNLAVSQYSDAIFNFSVPINMVVKYIIRKTNVDIKLNVFAMRFQMYLPFMYYNTSTGKMTDSVSNYYSHFSAQVGVTSSWFWQASYYK